MGATGEQGASTQVSRTGVVGGKELITEAREGCSACGVPCVVARHSVWVRLVVVVAAGGCRSALGGREATPQN